MKKWKVNLKLSKMKEQDLKDKFLRVEDDTTFYWDGYHDQRMLDDEVLPHAEKCVQIAKDYAEQEAIEFAKFVGQRYIRMHNVWCGIYQDQRNKENWITTKQLYQLFKNRENERK